MKVLFRYRYFLTINYSLESIRLLLLERKAGYARVSHSCSGIL